MVTMRNNPELIRRGFLLSLLVVGMQAHAKVTLTPALDAGTYAYGIKQQANGTDRGLAFEIAPKFSLDFTGRIVNSQLDIQARSLSYEDAQRSNEAVTDYSWLNQFQFNDQLQAAVSLQQSHSQQGSLASRYQDLVSNPSQTATTQSQNVSVNYQNDLIDWANFDANIQLSRFTTDLVNTDIVDTGLLNQDLSNQATSGNFSLHNRSRSTKFFYGLRGRANKTSRDQLDDQFNRQAEVVVGVPFFWQIGMIGQASVESNNRLNTNATTFDGYQNYKTVGGGLEWKLSHDSFWNITYNTVTTDSRKKGYVGTEFTLIPSSRTELRGRLDRRFFGRSLDVSGSYRLQHLQVKLSAEDTVGSMLGFSSTDSQSALFVCPPGVVPGLDNCYQPPTATYRPAQGERVYEFNLPGSEMSELIAIRRNQSAALGYDFNRLKVQLQAGRTKFIYIERAVETDSHFANVNFNWQLNQRNSVGLLLDYNNVSGIQKGQDIVSDVAGISRSVTLSWSRTMNAALSADLNIKRLNVAFQSQTPDYSENRLWLMAHYKF